MVQGPEDLLGCFRSCSCLTGVTAMSDTKHKIAVQTKVAFIPNQSDAEEKRYVFAYTITITNTGTVAAQLISRHWIITDANGEVQEVKGDGVIGEQPLLHPNESFEYTSGTAIATPVGTMRGSYQMVAEDGVSFDAPIPEFTLAMPRVLH
jgi:ApaG protein